MPDLLYAGDLVLWGESEAVQEEKYFISSLKLVVVGHIVGHSGSYSSHRKNGVYRKKNKNCGMGRNHRKRTEKKVENRGAPGGQTTTSLRKNTSQQERFHVERKPHWTSLKVLMR